MLLRLTIKVFPSAATGRALISQKKLDLYDEKSLHHTFVSVYERQPEIHCNKCNKCNIAFRTPSTGSFSPRCTHCNKCNKCNIAPLLSVMTRSRWLCDNPVSLICMKAFPSQETKNGASGRRRAPPPPRPHAPFFVSPIAACGGEWIAQSRPDRGVTNSSQIRHTFTTHATYTQHKTIQNN
jgi:hypothetical protein